MGNSEKSILVASDLSARTDRAVDRAAALARQWQANLIVIHVTSEKAISEASAYEDLADRVRSTLPDGASDFEIMIECGSPPKLIAKTGGNLGASLIVTGVARYNSIGDFVLGTTVDYVVRHADIPVLVVKQRFHQPYKSLLIATDFSECSRSALLKAASLFPDAELHLVHAYHVPYEGWLSSEGVREEIQKEAFQDLHSFMHHRSISDAVRQRCKSTIKYGETATAIADALRDTKADLMVLGTHGKNGFKHAMIGSNASSLLSWVPLDTLMVRD